MTTTPHVLASGSFTQSWANTTLIVADDDWSGVPSIVAYRGDDLTTSTGTDPQTILADGSGTPVDVNANQTAPDTFAAGGIAEFHIADPTVALNGSGTADAPHIVLYMDSTGRQNVTLSFNARDIDGSADDAAQQLAVQYGVGNTGDFKANLHQLRRNRLVVRESSGQAVERCTKWLHLRRRHAVPALQ